MSPLTPLWQDPIQAPSVPSLQDGIHIESDSSAQIWVVFFHDFKFSAQGENQIYLACASEGTASSSWKQIILESNMDSFRMKHS